MWTQYTHKNRTVRFVESLQLDNASYYTRIAKRFFDEELN